jgi:hypothetical protein
VSAARGGEGYRDGAPWRTPIVRLYVAIVHRIR